jgi:hypothetical protein
LLCLIAPETRLASSQPLFRAVTPAELADLTANNGVFRNLPGLEVKYFSTTAEGAAMEAQQAYQAMMQYGSTTIYQGPYTIVQTTIQADAITPIMRATVDGSVGTIVVPTKLLPQLSPAQHLLFTPIPH